MPATSAFITLLEALDEVEAVEGDEPSVPGVALPPGAIGAAG